MLHISCIKNVGISKLLTSLSTKLIKIEKDYYGSNQYLINVRQNKEIKSFLISLGKAKRAYKTTNDLSVALSFLYKASESLASTVKPADTKYVLNNIFRSFCVG